MIGCLLRCCSLADGNAKIPTRAGNHMNQLSWKISRYRVPFIKGDGLIVDSNAISDIQGIFQVAVSTAIDMVSHIIHYKLWVLLWRISLWERR